MPDNILNNLYSDSGVFKLTDQILFTHFHTDHFNQDLLNVMRCHHPAVNIYGPGLAENNVKDTLLADNMHKLSLPSGTIYAKDTLHEGNFKKDPHQSFLLDFGDESFFIAGDAEFTGHEAEEFLPYTSGKITGGFFNLYQLLSPSGIDFIKQLPFERIFLYHLPFSWDDKFNYRKLAKQLLKHPPKDIPAIELVPQMAWLDNKTLSKGAAYAVL